MKVDDGDGLGGVKIMCHEPLLVMLTGDHGGHGSRWHGKTEGQCEDYYYYYEVHLFGVRN